MIKRLPLYIKLSGLVFILLAISTICIVALAAWANNQYHNEVTQRLNRELAAYILDHHDPLMSQDGELLEKALTSVAMHVMMINPLVEVYLLDADGHILGHALDAKTIERTAVDPLVIKRFLQGDNKGPLYGDDPRSLGSQKIFSAAPIRIDESVAGYLYVVLSSHIEQSIADQLSGSYIVKVSSWMLMALIAAVFLSVVLGFKQITRPLRRLTRQAWNFRNEEFALDGIGSNGDQPHPGDELLALNESFVLMQDRIQSQIRTMQQNESLRRELVSNISHDLRTPLASIQGYIETVLLKLDQLSSDEKKHYLDIALKHSKRLGELVAELFELSRLETDSTKVVKEVFSLAELIHDIVQEFELPATKKSIDISVQYNGGNALVFGDLSLLARVFQNLIDNALRHTPTGGNIVVSLTNSDDSILVEVKDSGSGIKKEELPYIFDRYYCSGGNANVDSQEADVNDSPQKQGTGLGLAIVKRILELHEIPIKVISSPNQGASFVFPLPLAAAAGHAQSGSGC